MLFGWLEAERRFEPATQFAGLRWVHAVAPTAEEQERLVAELGLPREFLRHACDLDEVARLDRDEKGVELVMLRIPWAGDGAGELPFRTAPLAVMLLEEAVVTISPVAGDPLRDLGALERLDPARSAHFVLQLLARVAERFLVAVREIDRQVDALEERLERSQRNEEVLRLLRYQKSLVHFETALASNRILLERLQRDARFHESPRDEALLDDVLVEFRQATEMVGISANILSQMMDAFASIISNNLNVVMKLLTALTLLFAIPTAVASFFGMNVRLPFAGHERAFELTVGVSAVLVLGAALVFRRRRWL